MPAIIPAPGTSRSYMSHAASWPISRNGEPGSSSRSTRSRGSSLPRETWRSRLFSFPPSAAWATSARSFCASARFCAARARNSSLSVTILLSIRGALIPPVHPLVEKPCCSPSGCLRRCKAAASSSGAKRLWESVVAMNKPLLLILVSALALSACNRTQNGAGGTGEQHAQGTQSGIDKSLMDTAVKPGDDFNEYANGTWQKNTQIPADKSNIGVFSAINDEAQKREAALVQDIAKSNPSAGSDEARIANYYNAYMDTGAIEKRGLEPVKADIDRIEAIRDKGALADAIGHSLRADTDPLNATNFHTENLFGVFVTQGFNDPTKAVPYIMQGGLGLPDRDYYVSSDPAMVKLRADYTPYVAKILTLAGFPNAQARAQKIVALETKMAQAHETLELSQDSTKANNPWTRAAFDKKAP